MFEPFYESWAATMAAKMAFVGELPDSVRNWMTWMRFIFASSLWFAFGRAEARWVIVVNIVGLYATGAVAYYAGWAGWWGGMHILMWTPLLVYLFKTRGRLAFKDPYGIWVRALMATIVVSLLFDVKDVFNYLVG